MVATINTPAFAVTKSADQTISDVTLTTITFDVEDFDTDAAFGSNVFTCPAVALQLLLHLLKLMVTAQEVQELTCQE